MRSLQVRAVLVVVAAALLPVLALGAWARASQEEETRREHTRRLAATAAAAEQRVAQRSAEDRRAIERLCEADFVIDRLLLDLAAGRFGPARQDETVAMLPPLMRSLNLDVLEIVDARGGVERGRVLASAHFPGRTGAVDPDLLRDAARGGRRPFVRDVRVRREGQTHEERALLTTCTADRYGVRVVVVGGRFLDRASLEALLGDLSPVHLVLADPRGEAPGAAPTYGERREVHVFRDARGEPAARLIAAIDERPLRENLARLDRGFLVAGGMAFGGALLLGTILALTLARPLRQLESAARRVAGGDLESTIDVRHGGEVGRALSAFNRMTHELRATRERLLRAERIAAWRDIARRIAHEIKNPLSPIQVSIETMRKTYAKKHPDFDEIFEESTTTILEEVERLKRIVTEFSNFARLPRPRPTDLDVRDVVDHVASLHLGGTVAVRVDAPDDLPPIRADREQITQVLVNLVQNAVDAAKSGHGASGGQVRVVVRNAPGGGVVVSVQDDGPGIPSDQRSRVFEPYFTTKAGGTGLGLAIVHRIVDDHGGRVEVDDSPLGGAEFRVHLTADGPPPEADVSQSDGVAAVPLVQRRD